MALAGFGSDLSCGKRLTTGRMVGGRTLLAEAIWRRLTTPRGTLSGSAEASAYGLDLAAYVGAVGERIAEAALPSIVEAELLKDDRIAAVSVTATAYRADDGTTNNLAESYFARFRRMQYGQMHKFGNLYLANYANEAAFREDTRRQSNGAIFLEVAKRCAKTHTSRDWCGYWQGNKREAERLAA